MKRTQLLSALLIITSALFITSCKPSRVWATKEKKHDRYEKKDDRYYEERTTPAPPPPPRYYSSASLVISPSPGFVMKSTPDGRYYHRSQQGFLYWKGYDNRFYLDRSDLHKVRYSQWEYEQWKKYSRANG